MEKNIGRIWISLAIAVLVIVIWWQGGSLKALPTKPGDEPFLIALTQLGILYIVALFVERALEVLIKAWRQGGKVHLERVISTTQEDARAEPENNLTDIPHIPSKFVEIVPLSHRQGNCIPYAAIRWHDFGNRPALGRPLGHFSRHPDTPLLSLSPRRRFPRPTPERVFVADHQSSSGFSGTGPSAPPPQPIGT